MKRSTVIGVLSIVAILGAGGGYVAQAVDSQDQPPVRQAATSGAARLVFLDKGRTLAQVPAADPGAAPAPRGQSCVRSYTAARTTICLRPVTLPAGFEAVITRDDRPVTEPLHIDGTPSRARVSPSGRLAAWTVFRSGDSYDPGGFATTTGIYDTGTGIHHGSLEDFSVVVDGEPYRREDRNFWGVTFAADDETFYATMGSATKIWLLRGELSTRTLTAIGRDAECPSLSPDGTRLVYKKRVGEHWRLHVRDLAGGRETPLAEPAEVDDQAAWLDGSTVAYSRPVDGRPALFAVPADGGGAPRLLRREATSPALVSPIPS
ncbi:TolB family protein [Nonomuraea sp. NPDC050790]|uniref:TolB family protein n=1 Tax=Nonomuraea sp. NPDC050790 TaxID=3364371 RepID=UPI003794A5BA